MSSRGPAGESENSASGGRVKGFLGRYNCLNTDDTGRLSLMNCFNQKAGDKKCLQELGFKKCRPFLECDKRGKAHALLGSGVVFIIPGGRK